MRAGWGSNRRLSDPSPTRPFSRGGSAPPPRHCPDLNSLCSTRRRDKPSAPSRLWKAPPPYPRQRCGRCRAGNHDRKLRDFELGVLLDQKNPDAGFCLIRVSERNRSRHSSGDSPSDGSSSIRIAGADIMARPTATICRSPPLMVRTSWLRRSARRGNSDRTRSRFSLSRARARFGYAPSARFSFTVRSVKIPRSSGTSAMPASTISWGARREMSAGRPSSP